MAPAFTKLKENMQSVYKTEEHLSRVKQSKELGIIILLHYKDKITRIIFNN
jgi:hypothetical protein